jgi:large repetitive protein
MISAIIRAMRMSRHASRRRALQAALARLEVLESRLLLDGIGGGNVTVALNKGALVVTGDDYDNSIALAVSGSNLVVSGTNTTIGHASGFSIPLVQITKGIRMQLFDGNDRVTITGLTLTGKLTIDQGDGDNVVIATGCTFSGGVVFSAGNGDDVWNLSTSTVTGAFSIASGEGDDTVETASVTLTGNVKISAGNGYDSIDLSDTVVTGNVTVTNGDGGSSFTLVQSTGVAHITGNLTFTSGEGSDYLYLNSAQVDGQVKADFGHGSGDHGILTNNSTVGGNVTLKSLDGMGLYQFRSTGIRGNVAVNCDIDTGAVIFDAGATVAGNVTVNCKQSPLSLQIRGAPIHGNVSVRNGAGSSYVEIPSAHSPPICTGP